MQQLNTAHSLVPVRLAQKGKLSFGLPLRSGGDFKNHCSTMEIPKGSTVYLCHTFLIDSIVSAVVAICPSPVYAPPSQFSCICLNHDTAFIVIIYYLYINSHTFIYKPQTDSQQPSVQYICGESKSKFIEIGSREYEQTSHKQLKKAAESIMAVIKLRRHRRACVCR